MALHTQLYIYIAVCIIVCLIYIGVITGEEWNKQSFRSNYKLIPLPATMLKNETIVSEQSEEPTVVSCSLFCTKMEGASLYYNKNERICYCNNDVDTRLVTEDQTDDDTSPAVGAPSGMMYGYSISSQQVSTNTTTLKYDIQPYKQSCLSLYDHGHTTNAIYTVEPTEGNIKDTYCDMDNVLDLAYDDCLEWLQAGYTYDGVYIIRLSNGTTVRAWCDQTGGGWTVFQRRLDGSVDFYRKWAEYVNGFGESGGEYWLGLEAIYLLSHQQSTLRINMEAFDERPVNTPLTAFASYDDFSLASASDKYRISIGTFTGDCGDSLSYSNNRKFRTWDNDDHARSAKNYTGALWYTTLINTYFDATSNTLCAATNLNGFYHGGHYDSAANGVYWTSCWGCLYSMKTCSMGIKRN